MRIKHVIIAEPIFEGSVREHINVVVPVGDEPQLLSEGAVNEEMVEIFHISIAEKTVQVMNLEELIQFSFGKDITDNAPNKKLMSIMKL